MEKQTRETAQEEHSLYQRVAELHARNNTLNHEEDQRPVLEIVLAGAKRLPKIDLK